MVWHAGRPVFAAERGSTLALLIDATIQRITAATALPAGCPCCRCATPIRRPADLQSVTIAVTHTDIEIFSTLARAYLRWLRSGECRHG
jgi:hypothetical protein